MQSKKFETSDFSFNWYQTGLEKGKPLLILHGWGSSSEVMSPIAQKLKDLRTSYMIDLPGFGLSPEPPSAWSVDDYMKAVKMFILKQFPDPNVKIDLLVHSFGARIAIKMLTDKELSNRLDKIVFTGAAGLKPKRKAGYYFKKYSAKFLKFPFQLLPESLKNRGLNRLRRSKIWKKLGSSDYQQLSGVMRESFVKTVTEFMDSYIPQIEHEVLLIWGEDDQATPLDQAKRLDNALSESALIVIKGAGHYAFLDQPVQFISILRSYLESPS
ncbi:MAG: alpha/beta hydrolase [Balneolaceae bacterium]